MSTSRALKAAHELLPNDYRAIIVVVNSEGVEIASTLPAALTGETLRLAADEISNRQLSPDRN